MIETVISVATLAAIFYWGIKGAQDGLFRAFAKFCMAIFALIVTMRFWFPQTNWLMDRLQVNSEQVSFAAFWGVYALVVLPVVAALKTIHHDFIPAYPLFLDRVGGFLFSAANIAIIASAALLSFMPNMPSILARFDESKLLLPIHRFPKLLYHEVEDRLSPMSDPLSHTVLPVGERKTPDAPLEVRWK